MALHSRAGLRSWRAALAAPLMIAFSSSAFAQALEENILVDPGFNSGSLALLPFTDTDLERWMHENAALVTGLQADGVSPVEGDGMLRIQKSTLSASQVRQRIDLSALATQISGGGIRATATGSVNASVSGTSGGVLLIAFSPSAPGGTLTHSDNGLLDGDPGTWEASTASLLLPPDTTAVEMQYVFTNSLLPMGESGYGDDAALVLDSIDFGFAHASLGQSAVDPDGMGDIVISNVGSSGADGVSVLVGDNDFHLNVEVESPPVGAQVTFVDRGTVSAVPNVAISTLTIERTANGQLVTPSFAPSLGVSTYTLKLYNEGQLVYSQSGMSGTAGEAIGQMYTLITCKHHVPNCPNDIDDCPNHPDRIQKTYCWKGAPGCTRRSFTSFLVANGPAVDAGLLEIVADPNVPSDAVLSEGFEIAASDVSEFRITGEWLMPTLGVARQHLPVRSIGPASFAGSTTEDGAVVSNAGAPDDSYGALVDMIPMIVGPEVKSLSVGLTDLDAANALPVGALLEIAGTGVVQGVTDQPIGALEVEKVSSTELDLTPDLSALGAATYEIRVLSNGTPVTTVSGHSGVAATVDSQFWPTRLQANVEGRGVAAGWAAPVDLDIPGAGVFQGDELVAVAESGPVAKSIESAAVMATAIPSFTIVDGAAQIARDVPALPPALRLVLTAGLLTAGAAGLLRSRREESAREPQ